ncbi:LysR family transcriptional regulator [Klebsiella sp. ZJOU C1]|uniref:LysR family transcriptional regulator n=1 Tax=Klebsiella sp. ZJOU C1 TaxID=3111629 RepID=UPI002D7863F1|nr:LysR family transcriptional regulator [Klebsiella sp. ZJOU C1]WRR61822.1 LysR family transcriptional regulator [Klebsiella sp. ZJOU C1]
MEINRIGDVAAFVAAVKAGSYTQAAGSLGLTRSAVGKSIVRLETRLGVRLLNRTTRRLSLTDEGRIMYERCRQILEDLDEVDNMMAQRRLRPTGTLKLSAPLSFGQRHVLPLLETFLRNWPELQADIAFTDRYVDLIEEGFDLAIRIGEPRDDSRILTRTIATQKMVTCASAGYLARRGIPETPQALAEHDTIFFFSADRRRNWKFETPEGTWIFEGPGRLNIDSSEAMRVSALAGFGIIHLPDYMVWEDLKSGDLVPILKSYREKPEPIRIIYPSKRHLSPRIRGFIDLLVENWQEELPWTKGES